MSVKKLDTRMSVFDVIPFASKGIDRVVQNQSDRVDIVHQLKQVVCIKG